MQIVKILRWCYQTKAFTSAQMWAYELPHKSQFPGPSWSLRGNSFLGFQIDGSLVALLSDWTWDSLQIKHVANPLNMFRKQLYVWYWSCSHIRNLHNGLPRKVYCKCPMKHFKSATSHEQVTALSLKHCFDNTQRHTLFNTAIFCRFTEPDCILSSKPRCNFKGLWEQE